MGKEWNWGTGSKSSRRGGERREKQDKETKGNVGLPSGCMCAVFQWFDFHLFEVATSNNNNNIIHGQHQPPPHPSPPFEPKSFLYEDSPLTSGVEAPRNSLELEDSPFLSIPNEVEHLDTHMKKQLSVQIKTSIGDHKRSTTSKSLNRDQPIEPMNPSSPSSKTPNLVARLMGLDLLPDSPSSTSSLVSPQISHYNLRITKTKQPHHLNPSDASGTRSLPETPRVSSARRSDVDHRLSLQINKENISPSEELILSRISSVLMRKELNLIRKEEVEGKSSSSPRNLAKQIVKQVKESVSRRVRLDITNTISNRNKLDHEEFPWRDSSIIDRGRSNSTGVRFLDINSKLSNKKHVFNDVSTFVPTKPKLQEEAKKPIKTIRLAGLRKKQEEPFVRPTKVVIRENVSIKNDQKKMGNRMALTNYGLVSSMAPPTRVLPVKRDPTPPATKIPLRQTS